MNILEIEKESYQKGTILRITEQIIQNLLPDPNFYLTGYADMQDLLGAEYPYRYAISIAKKLDDRIIDAIQNGPTPEYHRLYESTNDELNALVQKISQALTAQNIPNLPVKATVHDHELDDAFHRTLRYPVSHKMIATRAGLGWIGKTDLFISIRFGPRIRLASILLNYPLSSVGAPITESRCGTCAICVKQCPAKAATGKLWNVHVDRNEFYDPHKCKNHCREVSRRNLDAVISLCGICVSVCPKGR